MRWIAILWAAGVLAQGPDPAAAARAAVDRQNAAIEKQRAAVELQRQASRKQAEFAARYRLSPPRFSTAPAPTPGAAPDAACEPMDQAAAEPLLQAASKRYDIGLDLLRAVVRQESGFRSCAVSPKGAMGLMQLMPETAGRFSVRDPLNPEENLDAGSRYLKELLGRYGGDLRLALGAYNAGPGNVTADAGLPDFAETRDYVAAILKELGPAALTPRPPPVSPASRPGRPEGQ